MIKIFRNFMNNTANIFRKPISVNYPKEKIIIPEGSKGMLHIKLDPDTLRVICQGCGKCAQACPKKCLLVEKDDKNRESKYDCELVLDAGKCIFCGNCVEVCELGAIEMSYRYQLAEYERKDLIFEKVDLVRQTDYTIRDFWSK